MLEQNSTLRSLNVQRNRIGPQGAKAGSCIFEGSPDLQLSLPSMFRAGIGPSAGQEHCARGTPSHDKPYRRRGKPGTWAEHGAAVGTRLVAFPASANAGDGRRLLPPLQYVLAVARLEDRVSLDPSLSRWKMQALGEMLQKNRTLKSLNLEGNAIKDAGAKAGQEQRVNT